MCLVLYNAKQPPYTSWCAEKWAVKGVRRRRRRVEEEAALHRSWHAVASISDNEQRRGGSTLSLLPARQPHRAFCWRLPARCCSPLCAGIWHQHYARITTRCCGAWRGGGACGSCIACSMARLAVPAARQPLLKDSALALFGTVAAACLRWRISSAHHTRNITFAVYAARHGVASHNAASETGG